MKLNFKLFKPWSWKLVKHFKNFSSSAKDFIGTIFIINIIDINNIINISNIMIALHKVDITKISKL